MTSVDRAGDGLPRNRRIPKSAMFILALCVATVVVMLLIARGVLPAVAAFVSVGLVLTAVFWQIRTHLASILLVFGTVALAGVVFTNRLPKVRAEGGSGDATRLSKAWATSGTFDQKLPVVIHLIFDELMATGAMTDDLPGGALTRQEFMDIAGRHSFRVFDSVYSRHYYTAESLSNLMHREYLGQTGMDTFVPTALDERTKTFVVDPNAYFDDMAARGYRTVVFQSTHMDFCRNRNVDRCETFDSFDPAGKNAGDTPTARVSLWQTFFRAYAPSYTSQLGQHVLGRVYGLTTGEVGIKGAAGRYDPQGFPQWFDRFTTFVTTVPRGTHVFGHFLVPHSPYLLLENCVVSGKLEEGYNLSRLPPGERDAKRNGFYERYFSQARCVGKKLDDFMIAIRESEQLRDAVIVVHGDHGSRISIGNVLEEYTPRDFVDNYATFFAVRAPGIAPGLDCEFAALPSVFRRYVATAGRAGAAPDQPLPVVVLSRRAQNTMVASPMPAFGCGETPAAVSP